MVVTPILKTEIRTFDNLTTNVHTLDLQQGLVPVVDAPTITNINNCVYGNEFYVWMDEAVQFQEHIDFQIQNVLDYAANNDLTVTDVYVSTRGNPQYYNKTGKYFAIISVTGINKNKQPS